MNATYPNAAWFKGEAETGREAAADVNRTRNVVGHRVFRHLAAMEGYGATPEETAEATGLPRVTVQPRFSELKAQRVIVDSGQRRRNPSSGKRAVVWVLKQYAPEPEPQEQ